MAIAKRFGTLPPLPDIVEVKPLRFRPGCEQGISTQEFRPRALKPVLKSNPSSEDVDGCWELDNDSEDAPSPASSSSGPIYERPAGFKFHAHSVRVDKPNNKKVKGTKLPPLVKDGGKKKEASSSSGTKPKIRKVPIPMKERSFPMSFLKEPNKTNPVIPPISSQRPFEDNGLNSLSIDQSREEEQNPRSQVFVSNECDQLIEKLFDNVKFINQKSEKAVYLGTYKPELSRRGDPCLQKSIWETLPSYQSSSSKSQMIKVQLPLLPTMAVKNNYSQTLTEIIEQL